MDIYEYYGKFNEDKRLDSRRGQVEFLTSIKCIHEYLGRYNNPKILDVGAGTGKYSVYLANEGYDVTAIELVKSNLGTLKAKGSTCKAYLGNALDLSRFEDESFDVTLLFGPMYHLKNIDDQVKALTEAKRVTKTNGTILVSYINNDYALLSYGFIDGHILDAVNNKMIDDNFKILDNGNDLYTYHRVEDIDKLNRKVNLKRDKIIAADTSANVIRESLKKLSDEEFKLYLDYHYSICERRDMLGTSGHILDILVKE